MIKEKNSINIVSEKSDKDYLRIRKLLHEVIEEIYNEDKTKKISWGFVVTRYNNEKATNHVLKIDSEDIEALEIISHKLKKIGKYKSAAEVDRQIADIKKKGSSSEELLDERPIKDFSTYAERSFPKENE